MAKRSQSSPPFQFSHVQERPRLPRCGIFNRPLLPHQSRFFRLAKRAHSYVPASAPATKCSTSSGQPGTGTIGYCLYRSQEKGNLDYF